MKDSYIKKADPNLKPAKPFGTASDRYSNRSSDSNSVYDYQNGSSKGFITYAIEEDKNK